MTSITIDGSRFLTNAETRTLTCNYQPPNADVMWRRNNDPVPDAPESQISTPSSGQTSLTISSFDQQTGNTVDLFECVVNNSVGGVVSEAIGLVEAASGTDMPGRVYVSVCMCVCVCSLVSRLYSQLFNVSCVYIEKIGELGDEAVCMCMCYSLVVVTYDVGER